LQTELLVRNKELIHTNEELAKYNHELQQFSFTISHNLRPVNLDRLGLAATIEEMVERVAGSSGIQFSADIEALENGLLTKEQEVNCFRIIQESLNNIVKHAQATKAYVELWRADGALLLTGTEAIWRRLVSE